MFSCGLRRSYYSSTEMCIFQSIGIVRMFSSRSTLNNPESPLGGVFLKHFSRFAADFLKIFTTVHRFYFYRFLSRLQRKKTPLILHNFTGEPNSAKNRRLIAMIFRCFRYINQIIRLHPL